MSVEYRDGHAYCDALPGSCYVLEDKQARISHLHSQSVRYRGAIVMASSYIRSGRYNEAWAILQAALADGQSGGGKP